MRLIKILAAIEIIIISTMIFLSNTQNVKAEMQSEQQKPIKVGVLLYRFDDAYISLVRQALEEIQNKNLGKVEFTFYDGKNDQTIQNKTINTILQNKSADFLLLNLVDVKSGDEVINRIKEYNMPVVLFNREPVNMSSVQSYGKAFFVGTNAAQAGTLQGKILIDVWNNDKTAIDRNGDNILQYVMLMGERDNKEAIGRTEYSVATINGAGIQTQQLALSVCDWNRQTAKENFEPLFLRFDNRIEAIISNNDEMAIGAIEVLQKYGYNKSDSTNMLQVVGIDAIPDAQELIKQGIMTGSVLQDASAMAEACYDIGINLFNGRSPLDGTQYTLDETGVAIRIPYREYKG